MKKIYFVIFHFENGNVIKSNLFFSKIEDAEKYAKGFKDAASFEISEAPLLTRW